MTKTQRLAQKRRRIDALPRYALDAMRVIARGKARDFIKYWQRNVRTDALGVRRLKERTVASKSRLGYKKPEVPLYGLGDSDPHTYINMMRIYALKNGYRVGPGRKKHHKSELKLRDLFVVHEFGCTINNGFGRGIHIRIPPRPTFFLSYEQFLMRLAKQKRDRAVLAAARQFANTGRDDLFRRISQRYGGRDRNMEAS